MAKRNQSKNNTEQTPENEEQTPENTEEKVTVSKKDLDEMVSEAQKKAEEKLSEKIKKQEEKISILEQAADKAQLQHVLSKHYPTTVSQKVRLNTLEGKIVTGWSMTTDIVEKNQNGQWVEKQVAKVELEGGTTQQLPYLSFHEKIRAKQVESTIKTEKRNEDGTVNYVVVREDTGDELEIPAPFVN